MEPRRSLVAWAITGAGHYLRESVEILNNLVESQVPTVVYISRAGKDVLRMYNLLDRVESLRSRGTELIYEDEESPSFPRTGKVYIDVRLVIVSPTTLNTLAKIASGICDSLVSNLVAHALKARVPVMLVVPDLDCPLESEVPIMIYRAICRECDERCVASDACPRGAIYMGPDGLPHIDMSRCDRCGACVEKCPHGAIKISGKVMVYPHPLLASLVERVRSMGIVVFSNPSSLLSSMVMRNLIGAPYSGQ
ncbi:MAG: flavoprotein [Crenarchaeota archaeon]|nr:flavoprotein [Thermoproteota archaeon]